MPRASLQASIALVGPWQLPIGLHRLQQFRIIYAYRFAHSLFYERAQCAQTRRDKVRLGSLRMVVRDRHSPFSCYNSRSAVALHVHASPRL